MYFHKRDEEKTESGLAIVSYRCYQGNQITRFSTFLLPGQLPVFTKSEATLKQEFLRRYRKLRIHQEWLDLGKKARGSHPREESDAHPWIQATTAQTPPDQLLGLEGLQALMAITRMPRGKNRSMETCASDHVPQWQLPLPGAGGETSPPHCVWCSW